VALAEARRTSYGKITVLVLLHVDRVDRGTAPPAVLHVEVTSTTRRTMSTRASGTRSDDDGRRDEQGIF